MLPFRQETRPRFVVQRGFPFVDSFAKSFSPKISHISQGSECKEHKVGIFPELFVALKKKKKKTTGHLTAAALDNGINMTFGTNVHYSAASIFAILFATK